MDNYMRIAELKSELDYIERHKDYLKQLKDELFVLENELKKKEEILKKENKDVEQLEKTNIASLYYKIIGNMDEKMEKERYEAMQASIDYHRVLSDYDMKKRTYERLNERIKKEDNLYIELKQLSLHVLREENPTLRDQLLDLMNDYEDYQKMIKEINEALQAGKRLKDGLDQAYQQLSKASHWGVYDMIGGGAMSSLIKHNHIGNAQESFQKINLLLMSFEKELKDVNMSSLTIEEIGEGLMIFDCFFDNVFADIMVQSKIEKSMKTITISLTKVEKILSHLDMKKQQLEEECRIIDQKIKEKIKN